MRKQKFLSLTKYNMNSKTICCIIIAVAIIIVILVIFKPFKKQNSTIERFSTDSPINILPVEDKVDLLYCSPDCCGYQNISFDGLTENEIKQKISNTDKTDAEQFIRTGYTCANGPNGIGCPCVRKPTYDFLADRGDNAKTCCTLNKIPYINS